MMKYEFENDKLNLEKRIFVNDISECERFPKYIMIEPIFACNAKCVMCGIYNSGKNSVGHSTTMPFELFEEIVDQIKPHVEWVEMVTLYGRGEPLLDRNLETKIRILRSIGIKRIQVSTNVSLLTKKRAKCLFESGLNDLRFSIDSIKKDVYESIRVGLNFEKVIENANVAIKVRNNGFSDCAIRIRAVEMDVNKDEKEEWVNYWQQRLSEKDVAQFMNYSAHTAREEILSDQRLYPCVSPFSTMVIRYDGTIHLCCNDFSGDIVIGDLQESSLVDIWRNEKIKKIRSLHLHHKWNLIPLCKNCTVWEEN